MTDSPCQIDQHDDHIIFTITRPARLNAITGEVLDGLTDCIEQLEQQSGNRGLIITGSGERAFCAGTDLVVPSRAYARMRFVLSPTAPATCSCACIERPSSASPRSMASPHGGGLELALACVFRIAAPHAACSLPEVKIGLIPAYAGTQLLPAVVGPSRALDMMLTGRAVASDEALLTGLINRIADNETPLLNQAVDYLASINQYSKIAINSIRECAAAAQATLSDEGLALERGHVIEVGKSEDAAEGVAAFREKRPAVFNRR